MLSWVPFYILLVACSTRRTHASPLYTDMSSDPQTDVIQRLEVEGEERESTNMGDHRMIKDMHPYLLQLDSSRDTWAKGVKDSSQQEKISNMVDYIKAAVLKLAAADNLRSQGFLRSEQGSPKANKRACFWKYCVTN
ncbi:urotensin-related peptide 1 [Megalops cyprinoides]|uniref:urotensin-related peptide 1 n=1 Tax=Megalops cyprinoides TaxID=118141 RepID=UPI001864857F|nr:urotensin-related peptide 1 [Megalops cyprinoides]